MWREPLHRANYSSGPGRSGTPRQPAGSSSSESNSSRGRHREERRGGGCGAHGRRRRRACRRREEAQQRHSSTQQHAAAERSGGGGRGGERSARQRQRARRSATAALLQLSSRASVRERGRKKWQAPQVGRGTAGADRRWAGGWAAVGSKRDRQQAQQQRGTRVQPQRG